MKAVRFIANFSFLAVFSFFGVYTVFAQETKDATPVTVRQSEIKPAVMPVFSVSPRERYRIGQWDTLEIIVAKHPDLSQGSMKLDSTGKIRMPRIDSPIMALCKTEAELAEEITRIYAATYLREPFVSVVVREQNSQPYSVIGAVKKPGSFFTSRDMTLLEILSFAGGPDSEFAGSKVQVARVGDISGCSDKAAAQPGDTDLAFFSFNLKDVMKGQTNPRLKPGDIVSVLDADIIYVYGNVKKEGQVKVKEPITLMQAIASAEGLRPSSKSKVRILRQKAGSMDRDELIFDLKEIAQRKVEDPFLQPNDIVAVSEDPTKSFLKKVGDSLTGGLGGAFYRIP
jgi:polysaccharide export outer membrane protein